MFIACKFFNYTVYLFRYVGFNSNLVNLKFTIITKNINLLGLVIRGDFPIY